jgi:NADH-quinone oxidoreductase subunit M
LLAIISATVVVLTAGYILWAVQRVFLGAEYKGPHEEALVPSTLRENAIATILFVLAIIFGVFPSHTILRYMDKTVEAQAQSLTEWTERNEANVTAYRAEAAADVAQAAHEQISSVTPPSIDSPSPAAELAAVTVHESPSAID